MQNLGTTRGAEQTMQETTARSYTGAVGLRAVHYVREKRRPKCFL